MLKLQEESGLYFRENKGSHNKIENMEEIIVKQNDGSVNEGGFIHLFTVE